MTSVEQIQQLVRIAGELGREVATGKDAHEIYKIGQTYRDADETLANLGYAPNRRPGQVGFTHHARCSGTATRWGTEYSSVPHLPGDPTPPAAEISDGSRHQKFSPT